MTENNQNQLPQNSESTDLPSTFDASQVDQEPNDLPSASDTNQTDQGKVQKRFDSLGVFVLRYLHYNGGSKAEKIFQDLATWPVKVCPDNLRNTFQNILDMGVELGYIAQNEKSEYITKLSEKKLKNLIDQVTKDASRTEPNMAAENVTDDALELSAGRSLKLSVEQSKSIAGDLSKSLSVDPSTQVLSFEPSYFKRVSEVEGEKIDVQKSSSNKVSVDMAKPVYLEAASRKREKKIHGYNLRPRKHRLVEQPVPISSSSIYSIEVAEPVNAESTSRKREKKSDITKHRPNKHRAAVKYHKENNTERLKAVKAYTTASCSVVSRHISEPMEKAKTDHKRGRNQKNPTAAKRIRSNKPAFKRHPGAGKGHYQKKYVKTLYFNPRGIDYHSSDTLQTPNELKTLAELDTSTILAIDHFTDSEDELSSVANDEKESLEEVLKFGCRRGHGRVGGHIRDPGRRRVANADSKSSPRQIIKRRKPKNRCKAGNNGRQATYSNYGPGRRRGRAANTVPETIPRQTGKRRKANNRRNAGRPTYTHPHYGRGHRGCRGGRGRRGRY